MGKSQSIHREDASFLSPEAREPDLQPFESPRRSRAVPNPQPPLIIRPVANPAACHPPPAGRPFIGKTTSQATRLGKIAPKMQAAAQ